MQSQNHSSLVSIFVISLPCTAYVIFACETCTECQQPNIGDNCVIKFADVFEVLQMTTTYVESAAGIIILQEFCKGCGLASSLHEDSSPSREPHHQTGNETRINK